MMKPGISLGSGVRGISAERLDVSLLNMKFRNRDHEFVVHEKALSINVDSKTHEQCGVHIEHGGGFDGAEAAFEALHIDGAKVIERHDGLMVEPAFAGCQKNLKGTRALQGRGYGGDDDCRRRSITGVVLHGKSRARFLYFRPDGWIKVDESYVAATGF